jgi:hypothetical protein
VLINKLKHKETGDIATQDDDLTKSEAYKSKQQIFKDKYKIITTTLNYTLKKIGK